MVQANAVGAAAPTEIYCCWSFPSIAELARKWLSAPATSTPAERVFFDCGNVDVAKRNRINGDAIKDQVMVKRNFDELELSLLDKVLSMK